MLNVIKDISNKQDFTKIQIEGLFSSIYFFYGIFQNIINQAIFYLACFIVCVIYSVQVEIKSLLLYLLIGSVFTTFCYLLIIYFQIRKKDVKINQVIDILKTCTFKDRLFPMYGNLPNISQILKKDIIKYVDIVLTGNNQVLKKEVEIILVNFEQLITSMKNYFKLNSKSLEFKKPKFKKNEEMKVLKVKGNIKNKINYYEKKNDLFILEDYYIDFRIKFNNEKEKKSF